MIKFFQNIRYELLGKNKTGRYLKYATGEIVLVMIGILLALEINIWNAERVSKKQEVSILSDLKMEYTKKLSELNQKDNLRGIMLK